MLLLEQRLRHLLEPTIAVCKDYTGPAYAYVPGLCAIFAFEFVAAYLGWGVYGLKGKKRGTLSSCFISISHGLATCTLCGYQLYTSFPFALDAWNSPGTNFVMQLSVAYMLVDMFMFLLPFTPGDALFVGHHIMTAAYMIMSLQINRGGLSCLILMALGESTSLFQNSWLIARELRRDNQAAMSAFKLLSPIYTYLFLLVRSLIAPPTIAWFAYKLQRATALPASCRYTWASFAILATAGSQIWSYKLWRGLRKNFSKSSEPVQEKPKAH